MGKRGGTSGKSTRGSAKSPVISTRITQNDFNNFVDSQKPEDYLGVLSPSSITVNDVEFKEINSYEFMGKDMNKRFLTSYQASKPDSKGEFPVIDLVVKQTKKRNKTSYSWDKNSLSGTKMY